MDKDLSSRSVTVLAILVISLTACGEGDKELRELERQLHETKRLLAETESKLRIARQDPTFYVTCTADELGLGQRIPDSVPELLAKRPLSRVDPVMTKEGPGHLAAYLFSGRACSFLGGDRITHINDVSVADAAAIENELATKRSWKFSVNRSPAFH